ncbi:MAG: PilN domain-containing protein [Thermoanaerobaculia bacterium]
MIKINLVGEGRRPVVSRQGTAAPIGPTQDRKADLWLAVLAIAGLLAAGAMFLLLNQKLDAKQKEITEAQAEVDRLAPIIREVEAFKAKKTELEHKIRVINQLKANQRGPVKIMDYVSATLPDLLWLTRMDVSSSVIKLTGEAFNTNAVATYIDDLDQVEEFSEPVLLDTQRRGSYYTFVIDVPYSFAPAATADGGEGEAATAASGG